MPDTVPCPKGDNPDRRSWFFDVSTASCRVSPTSGCDVTDDVGNRFYTLDECISTCLPGERAPHWFVSVVVADAGRNEGGRKWGGLIPMKILLQIWSLIFYCSGSATLQLYIYTLLCDWFFLYDPFSVAGFTFVCRYYYICGWYSIFCEDSPRRCCVSIHHCHLSARIRRNTAMKLCAGNATR